jgi:arginine deiminase
VIAGYGRNLATGAALDQAGYRVVTTAQVLTDANLNLLDGTKYLVQIEASELSRARGGPRCMTMPLSRESLRG